MNTPLHHLPLAVTLLLLTAAGLHGPIAQPADYHHFAAQAPIFGIPRGADVFSNLGFALVALWGWRGLAPTRELPALLPGRAGYRSFLLGLFLTAFGSAWYHLAPDNASLVWDRLPIAIACAGLLVGVYGDVRQRQSSELVALLMLAAVASVAWWYFTALEGEGDLRPYLLLQALPLLLIPLWQWIYRQSAADRLAFGAAIAFYIVAKLAELKDHEIQTALGVISGHTLKHLLATIAAGLIVAHLRRRVAPAATQRLDAKQASGFPALHLGQRRHQP